MEKQGALGRGRAACLCAIAICGTGLVQPATETLTDFSVRYPTLLSVLVCVLPCYAAATLSSTTMRGHGMESIPTLVAELLGSSATHKAIALCGSQINNMVAAMCYFYLNDLVVGPLGLWSARVAGYEPKRSEILQVWRLYRTPPSIHKAICDLCQAIVRLCLCAPSLRSQTRYRSAWM